MHLFKVTITFTQEIGAFSAAHAEERIRQAYEMPPDARIEAEGPIDATGGDGVEE